MSEPIWSRHFAWDVAKTLGYSGPVTALEGCDRQCQEVQELVEQITEDFRYLPGEQINWSLDLARFLRATEIDAKSGQTPSGWLPSKLREVREYVLFLRGRHGHDQPADESDEWTDEDRRDCTIASINRWDEREA